MKAAIGAAALLWLVAASCDATNDAFMCGRACGPAGMRSFHEVRIDGCSPPSPVCECNPPTARTDGGTP